MKRFLILSLMALMIIGLKADVFADGPPFPDDPDRVVVIFENNIINK